MDAGPSEIREPQGLRAGPRKRRRRRARRRVGRQELGRRRPEKHAVGQGRPEHQPEDPFRHRPARCSPPPA